MVPTQVTGGEVRFSLLVSPPNHIFRGRRAPPGLDPWPWQAHTQEDRERGNWGGGFASLFGYASRDSKAGSALAHDVGSPLGVADQ